MSNPNTIQCVLITLRHRGQFSSNSVVCDDWSISPHCGLCEEVTCCPQHDEWPNVTAGDCHAIQVQILKGIDTGKQGIVCSVIKERNWCYVEGLNCVYKWAKRTSTNPGFMSKAEKPLLVTTEVALVDPSDTQPTTVEWRYDEDGNRVRISLRTGRIIPLSQRAQNEGEDFIDKLSYKTQSCDTAEKELLKVTFKPSLKTFEQDIMDSMGIKEERKRAPNFYY